MNKIHQTMGPVEWLLLVTLSLLWGGSFFFVGVAVEELGPLTIVALRVGLAAILNASTPLFTVVVAHYLTRDEPLTSGRIAGVLIGFAGVAFMLGPDIQAGTSNRSWAQVAVLAGALSYAFAGVFGRRFRTLGCPPMITACGQVTASATVLIPLALMMERFWGPPWPGLETWSALLGLALLSTMLAYIVYFRLLATAGATNLLLVTFLIPVSAILLGTLFLGERLALRHLAGMGLIGVGLAAIDGRPLERIRRRKKRNGTL